MSEEAASLLAEAPCGQRMALQVQQGVEEQRGRPGNHLLHLLLLREQLGQAAHGVGAGGGAEEVGSGQVAGQAGGGGGGEGQQAGHQAGQARRGCQRGGHLRRHQPHAVAQLQDAGAHGAHHIRVERVLLLQPLAEALLGALPHGLLPQQGLDGRASLGRGGGGSGGCGQGLEELRQQRLNCRSLADAAQVVLQLLEEAAILGLTGPAGLLPGQLGDLLPHLLHADPQVPVAATAERRRVSGRAPTGGWRRLGPVK